MHGLDQFDNITLFNPLSDSLLQSELHMGYQPNANVNFTLGIDLKMTDSIINKLEDYVGFSLNVGGMHILLNLTTDFNQGSLYNTSFNSIIHNPVCLLKGMQMWGFNGLTATVERAGLKISCIKCTSPSLVSLSN